MMKSEQSEVSIDQLATLARGAGVSAEQELPPELRYKLNGNRRSDKALYQSAGNTLVSRALGMIRPT